jgi:hypothetical protein
MENEDFQGKGFIIFKGAVEGKTIDKINDSLEISYSNARKVQEKNQVDINMDGTIHHLPAHDDDIYLDFLDWLCKSELHQFIRNYFQGNFILNSYGGLKNLPSKPSYVTKVHRDIRFFSGDFPLMLNMLVMLDDFTIENGATYVLSGSHKVSAKPDDETFYLKADRVTGTKGDVLFFNSNLWHAAGVNKTQIQRRALTLTFTKPFMKQQLDYSKAIGYDKLKTLSPEIQQLAGYFSRTPSDLNEWYRKPEERFYRPGQD